MDKFLLDVCNITTGNLDSNAAVENGRYPFFTCAPEPLRIDNYAFNEDAILLAGNNAQGNFHINRYKGKFNAYQRTYVITAKENFDIDYLKYSIEISLNFLKKLSQGSQTKFLTMAILEQFKLKNIPFEKQKQQVACLVALDEKISLNKKINATLETMAKILYDYWFLQFDFPDENGKPYKSSGGKMIFNAELVREIPAGWEVKTLGEIAKIIQGNSPEGKTLNETGDGMIFFQGKTDFGFRFPKVRIYTTAPYRLAEKFDTLLSVRAPVGAVNMANKKCCIGRGLAAIKSDYPSFIFYTIKKLRKILETISGIGTTFDSITKEDLIALKICIPPKEIIQKFENTVSKFDNEVFLRENENNNLENLRDFLLPLLMNGQVTIKD